MTPRPDTTEPDSPAYCAECEGMHTEGNGLCDIRLARHDDERRRWGKTAEELSRDYGQAWSTLRAATMRLCPIPKSIVSDHPPTADIIRREAENARKALDAMLAIADTVEPKP